MYFLVCTFVRVETKHVSHRSSLRVSEFESVNIEQRKPSRHTATSPSSQFRCHYRQHRRCAIAARMPLSPHVSRSVVGIIGHSIRFILSTRTNPVAS